jgi:hypothetical protein
MTTKPLGKIGRYALWTSPIAIVIVGFFAAIPWLKEQNDTFVLTLSAALSIFVMGYAHFLSQRCQRHLDEVQIASQGFASSRGWPWGVMATALLLMLPPVTNRLIDLANVLSTGSPDTPDRRAVHLALVFGFMLMVLIQALAVIVASVIWQRRMGPTGEPS